MKMQYRQHENVSLVKMAENLPRVSISLKPICVVIFQINHYISSVIGNRKNLEAASQMPKYMLWELDRSASLWRFKAVPRLYGVQYIIYCDDILRIIHFPIVINKLQW